MAKLNLKDPSEVPFSFMVSLEVLTNGHGYLYIVRDFRTGAPLKISDDVNAVAPFVLQFAEDLQAINTTISANSGQK